MFRVGVYGFNGSNFTSVGFEDLGSGRSRVVGEWLQGLNPHV